GVARREAPDAPTASSTGEVRSAADTPSAAVVTSRHDDAPAPQGAPHEIASRNAQMKVRFRGGEPENIAVAAHFDSFSETWFVRRHSLRKPRPGKSFPMLRRLPDCHMAAASAAM